VLSSVDDPGSTGSESIAHGTARPSTVLWLVALRLRSPTASQKRDDKAQRQRVDVRWGQLRVKTLTFELPAGRGDSCSGGESCHRHADPRDPARRGPGAGGGTRKLSRRITVIDRAPGVRGVVLHDWPCALSPSRRISSSIPLSRVSSSARARASCSARDSACSARDSACSARDSAWCKAWLIWT
jgi:hypothetical protein